MIGDSRVKYWGTDLKGRATLRGYYDIDIDVHSYPGARCRDIANKLIYHPAKLYDLVYTHVGINNLTDKGKGKNALQRFPSPSAAFSHLIGELAEMKRCIQPIAH